MADEQLRQLAETLKKTGMAASMYEAMEKAKSIMNVKSQNAEPTIDNPPPVKMPDLDVNADKDKATLNELMREVKVSPEEVEKQEQEKTKGGYI